MRFFHFALKEKKNFFKGQFVGILKISSLFFLIFNLTQNWCLIFFFFAAYIFKRIKEIFIDLGNVLTQKRRKDMIWCLEKYPHYTMKDGEKNFFLWRKILSGLLKEYVIEQWLKEESLAIFCGVFGNFVGAVVWLSPVTIDDDLRIQKISFEIDWIYRCKFLGPSSASKIKGKMEHTSTVFPSTI